jgi:hypothetical protein
MKRFHFTIGLHALATIVLLVVLFALPFVAMAQDSELPPELPEWTLGLPSVLIGLMAFNFKSTEWFKRTLSSTSDSKRVPFELSKDVQGTFVLLFSVGLGLGSAWVVPHANDFVVSQYPDMPLWGAVLCTGFLISVVGGIVYEVLGRLGSNKAIYETKTTISTPQETVSDKAAVASMSAVAEAAKG